MDSVIGMLNTSNFIEDCDMGALRMLMVSYEMYRKASETLLKDGPIIYDRKGNPSEHPANKITKNYYSQILSYMREFGLTIKSRERIRSLAPSVDEDNPILKFLREENEGVG